MKYETLVKDRLSKLSQEDLFDLVSSIDNDKLSKILDLALPTFGNENQIIQWLNMEVNEESS